MKKLTRRAYNRKVLMFGAAIFMSVAMISTGFAAWVMSSVTGVENAEGPVVVSTVSDKVVEISVDQWDGETWSGNTLTFDAEKGDHAGRVVNSADDDTTGANLKLEITGAITNHDALASATATVKLPKSIVDAINAKYIKILNVGGIAFQDSMLSAADTDGTKTLTYALIVGEEFDASIEFGWGDAFHSANPSVYYDTDYSNETDGVKKTNAQMKEEMNAFAATLQAGLTPDDAGAPTTYSGTIYITITGETN